METRQASPLLLEKTIQRQEKVRNYLVQTVIIPLLFCLFCCPLATLTVAAEDIPLQSKPPRTNHVTILLAEEQSVTATADGAYDLENLHFNPLLASSQNDKLISQLLYRPLYHPSQEYTLLDRFFFSSDGKTLNLKLKPNLYWGQQELLTSRDLYYSLSCLLNNPSLTTFPDYLNFLKGYDKHKANLAAQVAEAGAEEGLSFVTPKAEPLLPLLGIHVQDDLELELYFTKDMRAYEKEILNTPVIPAFVWWKYDVADWPSLNFGPPEEIETEELPESETEDDETPSGRTQTPLEDWEYLPVGSGPFTLDFTSDSEGLELVRTQPLPINPETGKVQSNYVESISIRYSPLNSMLDEMEKYTPDLVFFPTLEPESETALVNAGYNLSFVPSTENLQLLFNQDKEETFLNEEISNALTLLLPSLKEMQSQTNIPLFPFEIKASNLAQSKLAESYAEVDKIEFEGRVRKTLHYLLEAEYYTIETNQEAVQEKSSENITLKMVPTLNLAYLDTEAFTAIYVQAIQDNFAQAGIYLNANYFSPEVLSAEGNEDLINQYDLVIVPESTAKKLAEAKNPVTLPLLRRGYTIAHKRITNFETRSPYYFLGSEDWVLEE